MPEFVEPRIASLSPDKLKKVETVENKIGHVYVVAYDQPVVPARLNPEQIKALQDTEREVGACLVAYEKR